MQDPQAAAGAVVLDCHPPLLPVSMNVSGADLSAIQSPTMAAEADAAAGAVVLDCRPPLLTVSMNVSGVDLSAIQSPTMAAEADAVPQETGAVIRGGGGGEICLA